jgi:hypothetical protein
MSRISQRKSAYSWPALTFAAAISMLLTAGQASSQSVPKQSTAANGQPNSAAQELNPAEVLRKAETSYYSAQRQGLQAFRCNVQVILKQPEGDPSKLARLKQIQYSVVVDDQGKAIVTPFRADGGAIDHDLDEAVGGAQQTIEGFFQSWNNFVFLGIFTPSADKDLAGAAEQPDGFHFTERNGDTNLELVLAEDSLWTMMKMSSPLVIIQMWPKFTRSDNGWLMTSADSDINNGTQKVSFQILYQPIEGFQLPETVEIQVAATNQAISIEMKLSSYQLTKR